MSNRKTKNEMNYALEVFVERILRVLDKQRVVALSIDETGDEFRYNSTEKKTKHLLPTETWPSQSTDTTLQSAKETNVKTKESKTYSSLLPDRDRRGTAARAT
jgi:hypothetical protein